MVAEKYETIVKEIHARGHEIAAHGYMHEEKAGISYVEADAIMEQSEKIIEGVTGKRPVGYRAPGAIIHPFTIEMLHKPGYIYTSSWRDRDCPFFHKLDGKEIPMVDFPQDSIFDDTAYFMVTNNPPIREGIKPASDMIEIWKDEFDGLAAEGDKAMSLVIHPQCSGRVSRINAIGELIGYMKSRGAWFARSDEAARYFNGKKK